MLGETVKADCLCVGLESLDMIVVEDKYLDDSERLVLGPSLPYLKTIGVVLRANDNLDVIFSERTLYSGRLEVLAQCSLCPPAVCVAAV
jgi:hypothetical protein